LRTGEWWLHSGIQESNGGVARYYRTDVCRNLPVSTEITGYAVSTLVYLHAATRKKTYLERAVASALFLTQTAWDPAARAMPFEIEPAAFSYFFDCGIIVRGLLAAWRATGGQEFLDVAIAVGDSMLRDFASGRGDFHPILRLPEKCAEARDEMRWSRTPACYQLKSAMAWFDLWEATGEVRFSDAYDRVLEHSLCSFASFLPGHPDRHKVMDRLHAFGYFLEGLLPRAADSRCAAALRDGIACTAHHLRAIAAEFERSDVYAQLLRVRLYAEWLGAVPLDVAAAEFEAETLAGFQAASSDPRVDGGYWFGRKGAQWLPFVNPVSTAFSAQALELWEARRRGDAQPHRHLLI
jgi:hypothetical protein